MGAGACGSSVSCTLNWLQPSSEILKKDNHIRMLSIQNYILDRTSVTYQGLIRAEHVWLQIAFYKYFFFTGGYVSNSILYFLYFIIPSILLIGKVFYCVKNIWEDRTVNNWATDLAMTVMATIGVFIVANVFFKKAEGYRLFQLFEDCPFVKLNDPHMYKKYQLLLNRFQLCGIILIIVPGMALHLVAILMRKYYNTAPLVGYYFFDGFEESYWQLSTDIFSMFESIFLLCVVFTSTSILFSYACYLQYHCTVLCQNLGKLKYEFNIAKRHADLQRLIQHHMFVIEIWDRVNTIYKNIIFVVVLCASAMMGLVGIALQIEINVLLLGVGCLVIGMCFMIGHVSARLDEMCENLENAIFYAIPWDGDIATAKTLQFMNLRARLYFKLTMARFGVMNNETVMEMGKSAYSLITFYRRTQQ